MITRLVLFLLAVSAVRGRPQADDGPLFLTPYIENNQIDEAKKAALVPPLTGGVESYAGFFTVNQAYNSNMYLWYFPAQNATPDTPVMVWLDGWSTSMLYGVFMDHGPYQIDSKLQVSTRDYSWNKMFNMIYIDSLVGTGFSFTENPAGYQVDEEGIRKDLYEALNQFFKLFPELQSHAFYLAGESYGGHYVPALGDLISQNKAYNLQGIILGNPWVDPPSQIGYAAHLHDVGLIDQKTRDSFEQTEAIITQFLSQNLTFQAAMTLGGLIFNQGVTMYTQVTGNTYYYNYLDDTLAPEPWREYVQTNEARKKMHTGNLPLQFGALSSLYLSRDVIMSTKPYLEKLIDGYRTLLYNGHLDIICAYPMMENMILNMNCSDCCTLYDVPRKIWYDGPKVGAYVKVNNHLSEVVIKEAGHLAIVDQPSRVFSIVQQFLSNTL